jgi:hypothetical protein
VCNYKCASASLQLQVCKCKFAITSVHVQVCNYKCASASVQPQVCNHKCACASVQYKSASVQVCKSAITSVQVQVQMCKCNTKAYKSANFAWLYFPYLIIFFATKRHNVIAFQILSIPNCLMIFLSAQTNSPKVENAIQTLWMHPSHL